MKNQIIDYYKYLIKIVKNSINNEVLNYNLIIGNQSADLDSVVSAISYSKLLNLTKSSINFCKINPINGLHIPIINCNKKIMKMKFPLINLISYFSNLNSELIDIEEIPLLCIDDHIIETILNKIKHCNSYQNQLYITLVDHNIPSESQKFFKERIVSIIDHHDDKEIIKPNYKLSLGTKIGSCSSLIGTLWKEAYINNKINKDDLINNRIYLIMIIATIIKDTSNFNIDLYDKRWCSIDIDIYKWLVEVTNIKEGTCLDLHKKLGNSNRDLNLLFKFDLFNLFLMDYKIFVYNNIKVGYSSFEINITSIITHYNTSEFYRNVNLFTKENKIDIFLILSTFVETNSDHMNNKVNNILNNKINMDDNGINNNSVTNNNINNNIHVDSIMNNNNVNKQLLIYSDNLNRLNNIINGLRHVIKLLDINMKELQNINCLKLFRINDLSFSRKKLEPIINNLIECNEFRQIV